MAKRNSNNIDILSQHSYATHASSISRSQAKTHLQSQTRSTISTISTRTTPESSVSSHVSRDKEGKDKKYYELAKKLYEEKKELKKLLKKSVHDHSKELLSIKEQHNSQLNMLLKEKSLLLKQSENNKKLQASFTVEKENNKKLEQTIITLQEKLSEEEQRVLSLEADLKENKERFSSSQKEKLLKHNNEITLLKSDYEKRIYDIEQQQKMEIERIRQIYTEQNAELRSEAQRCRNEMESIRQEHLRFFSSIPSDDQGIKRLYNEILEYKQSITNSFARKEEELNRANEKNRTTLRSKYETTISELQELNTRQKDQIAELRNTMRNLQENMHNSTNQIINSLTTQKNALEKQLISKDKSITQLQIQLKSVAEESVSQMNLYERKTTELQGEYQNIFEKYENLKSAHEKINNSSLSFMGELKSYKDIQINLQQKIESLQAEKEKLEYSLQQRQKEYEKYRGDSIKLFDLENRYNDEKTEFAKSLSALKLENEELRNRITIANGNLENEKYKNTKLSTLLQQSQDKNNSFEIDNSKKDLVLEKIKTELDSLQVLYNNLFTENSKQRAAFQEELLQKISTLDDQRKSEIRDLAKKNTDLENIIKLMKKELDKQKAIAAEANKAKETMKTSLEFYTSPDGDYRAKIDLVNELQTQLLSSATKYNMSINELNKQLSSKDKEIEELQRKLKAVEIKDSQINTLSMQLSSIQNNYKSSFEKLTNDHKKDRKDLADLRLKESSFIDQSSTIKKLQEEIIRIQEECNNEIRKQQSLHRDEVIKLQRELTDVQVVIAQCDQKIELSKLSNITEVAQGKRTRLELENKVKELEEKNNNISLLLSSTESKYGELQAEFAKAIQTVNIEKQKLEERYKELSKYEKELRDAPPKLLDPSLRQSRDEALTKMREMKGTIADLTEKLSGYEEIKKELQKKNEKIEEYEKIFFAKFNNS